jgi:hypothetical protein
MLVVIVACVMSATLIPDTAYAQRGGRGGGGGGQAAPRGGGGGHVAPRGGGGGPRGGAVMPRGGPSGPRGPAVGTGTRRNVNGAPVVGHAVPRGSIYPGRPGYPGGHYPVYYGGRYIYGGYPYWGWYGWGYGWGGWGGWWGPGWYGSMWWPGWGWWGPAGPYYAVPYGVTSDARLLVKPRDTEVYVDGALAGIVDNYDGVFQSLRLAPGTHEITLYLDGHRRYSQNVYVAPGSTLKVRHTMEPLPQGAPADERPSPSVGREPATTQALPVEPAAPSAAQSRPRQTMPGEAGVLVIRVQPSDAEILIDGQRWQSPDASRPLEVRVPAGRVRVEIRKPGHAPFSTEVTVEPGVETPLNVSLPSRGQEM